MTDADTERQILELERCRGEALVQRDLATLQELLTDDLVHVHSTGQQMDKAELLHYVMSELQFITVTRADLKVRVRGDVAVMTGRMRNSMRRHDHPDVVTADALVTQVWVRNGSSWRQSNFHSCRAAEPAKS